MTQQSEGVNEDVQLLKLMRSKLNRLRARQDSDATGAEQMVLETAIQNFIYEDRLKEQ